MSELKHHKIFDMSAGWFGCEICDSEGTREEMERGVCRGSRRLGNARAIPPAAQQAGVRPSPEAMEWLLSVRDDSRDADPRWIYAREILSFLTSNAQPSSGEPGKREEGVTAGGESVETSACNAFRAADFEPRVCTQCGFWDYEHRGFLGPQMAEREPVPTPRPILASEDRLIREMIDWAHEDSIWDDDELAATCLAIERERNAILGLNAEGTAVAGGSTQSTKSGCGPTNKE